MIKREDYLNALELIDQYHQQLNLQNVRCISTVKTPINEWEFINKCSTRLRNILYHKPIYMGWDNQKNPNGFEYIEDISRSLFFWQRNAGEATWNEFIKLRGF